jgi:hypothetical protein
MQRGRLKPRRWKPMKVSWGQRIPGEGQLKSFWDVEVGDNYHLGHGRRSRSVVGGRFGVHAFCSNRRLSYLRVARTTVLDSLDFLPRLQA